MLQDKPELKKTKRKILPGVYKLFEMMNFFSIQPG